MLVPIRPETFCYESLNSSRENYENHERFESIICVGESRRVKNPYEEHFLLPPAKDYKM